MEVEQELEVMEGYMAKNYNVMRKEMKRQRQLRFVLHDVEYH